MLLAACNSGESTVIYWVNSYRVDCVGVGPMKCLLVQKGETIEAGEWTNFYSEIEGFDYEPGFLYKLKVKEEPVENVPADASSVKYTLVEVLEKREDDVLALNGSWEVLEINSSVITLPESPGTGVMPMLQIDIKEMQASGVDNCNNFRGEIKTLTNTEIVFGMLASTRKMCPDMTIADQFNNTLPQVRSYKIAKQKLSLLDENGKEIILLKKVQ